MPQKKELDKKLLGNPALKKKQKEVTVVVPPKDTKRWTRIERNTRNGQVELLWLVDFRGIDYACNPCAGDFGKRFGKMWFEGGKVGCSGVFRTPEELQRAVDSYFESCYSYKYDKYGELIRDRNGQIVKVQTKPFTMTGLASYCKTTRATISAYGRGTYDNEGCYSIIIRRAKQRIEEYAETRLYDKDGYNGARFVLDSGFGWATQKEIAEINKMNVESLVKQEEFKLKKMLAEMGEDDAGVEIKIVRKSKDG